MCGLCGILTEGMHWSDRTAAVGPVDHVLNRRDRMRRVALLNRILKAYSCSLSDWQGVSYVLSTFTGKTEIVHSLTELWPMVERLTGRQVDPLANTHGAQ